MAKYIVNTNAQVGSGDHEVHNISVRCDYLPDLKHQHPLGDFLLATQQSRRPG